MPSTFTANLNLEKQATGEHDNIWGDHLNTLFDQLDRAVAGRISIAGGDQTLTADQYENRSIEFTGGLGANATVIFPSIEKGWLIKNSTTGGFTLTCKTSAGTGVIVNRGDFALIEGDGTNIISNRFVTQDGQENYGGNTGGAADAYTLTVYPAIAAYRAGQRFRGKWHATSTATNPTLAVSGLAAKTLKLAGNPIPTGGLVAGKGFETEYDGTDLQLLPYWGGVVQPTNSITFTGTDTFQGPVTFAGTQVSGTTTTTNTTTIGGPSVIAGDMQMSGAAFNDGTFVDVASGTVDLSTVHANNLRFTGTQTTTALGTVANGIRRRIRTAAAQTFVHDGTNIIAPNARNIVAAADDVYDWTSLGAGSWLLSGYKLATGKALFADFEKLITKTASSSTSLDFDFSAVIAQFTALKIVGSMIAPATNAVDLWLETSQDGTTFDTGTANYAYSTEEFTPAGANSQSSSGDTKLILNSADTLGNGANQNLSFEIIIYNPNQAATFGFMTWTFGMQSSSSRLDIGRGSGRRLTAAAIKGLRLLMSSGNIAAGLVNAYGIR